MKAKELIKILENNPEAEVGHLQYVGGPTIFLPINDTKIIKKGETSEELVDGGDYLTEEGNTAKKDLFLLKHDSNKN